MARAQVPLSLVEAGVGVLLILGLAAAFTVSAPPSVGETAQLDAYATDALTILGNEQPRHAGQTRLEELTRSAAAFERERESVRRRADRLLPENVMFRIGTRHGRVGYRLPADVATGSATVPTASGSVTIRVWYV